MKKLLILLLTSCSLWGNYRFEGYFNNDGPDRFFVMSFFVPYNPTISLNGSNPKMIETCSKWWPKGDFCNESAQFLWIESDDELDVLKETSLDQTTLIYTSTHCNNYYELKNFLEQSGFTPLCHWYYEGNGGQAIYVRNDIFFAAMRTLNYLPDNNQLATPSSNGNNLSTFFQPAYNKETHHKIEGIDFIYMINLDERPEKFESSLYELEPFGIVPYRFPAVNGWKLKNETLNQIGAIFPEGSLLTPFMGTTYLEVDGKEYQNNEILKDDGKTTYFSYGMSRGSIGICLSHLSVIQDALVSGYNTIWVMEDDIEVVGNPLLLPTIIENLDKTVPDWDILFTDTDTKDRQGIHVACRAIAARPNFNIPPLVSFFNLFYPVNHEFSRTGMRYGAYSMIIRRSGMQKILNHFKTYGIYLPYDMDYWLAPHLKMYTVNKDIISHRAGAATDNNKPHYDP